jgi:hypothetical protein
VPVAPRRPTPGARLRAGHAARRPRPEGHQLDWVAQVDAVLAPVALVQRLGHCARVQPSGGQRDRHLVALARIPRIDAEVDVSTVADGSRRLHRQARKQRLELVGVGEIGAHEPARRPVGTEVGR